MKWLWPPNSVCVSFEELKTKWTWKPIHNCPGRFILDQQACALSPEEIINSVIEPCEFQVEGAKDTVIAVQLSEGGLISYRKKNGRYVHTLNTPAGFERKLQQLGIRLSNSPEDESRGTTEHNLAL